MQAATPASTGGEWPQGERSVMPRTSLGAPSQCTWMTCLSHAHTGARAHMAPLTPAPFTPPMTSLLALLYVMHVRGTCALSAGPVYPESFREVLLVLTPWGSSSWPLFPGSPKRWTWWSSTPGRHGLLHPQPRRRLAPRPCGQMPDLMWPCLPHSWKTGRHIVLFLHYKISCLKGQ